MRVLTLDGSSRAAAPRGSEGSGGAPRPRTRSQPSEGGRGADTRDSGGAELPAALGSLIWGRVGMLPEYFCPSLFQTFFFLPDLQTPTNFPADPFGPGREFRLSKTRH